MFVLEGTEVLAVEVLAAEGKRRMLHDPNADRSTCSLRHSNRQEAAGCFAHAWRMDFQPELGMRQNLGAEVATRYARLGISIIFAPALCFWCSSRHHDHASLNCGTLFLG